MTRNPFLKNTQLGIFNPGRLSDHELEQIFVARHLFFDYMMKKIADEAAEGIPQHHLIIGQRGMGKSTLLHRIAAELRRPPYKEDFIPLTFSEEQYNVDRLSKFWLNCLDALADALEREDKTQELPVLDQQIRLLEKTAQDIPSEEIYATFLAWCEKIGRRVVLLVDNLNLILGHLAKEDQHKLRAVLMKRSAPLLVGASSNSFDEILQYEAPFYDAFQVHTLKKLSFEEAMEVLNNLAIITGRPELAIEFINHRARLRTLYELTGGTPRTLVLLFPLIQNGFSPDVNTDLEALLDMVTPLYKARFEEVPQQMQVILDAVALNWDPIALEGLREKTHLANNQLSPQLKRLVETGWLLKLKAYQKKGAAFEINERFFNIWYLMRRSSRRQKRELLCLTRFLATMYGDELPQMGQGALQQAARNQDQASVHLAMANAFEQKSPDIEAAVTSLKQALLATDGKISSTTQDDWQRFAAIALRLNYGEEVLHILKETGHDTIIRPYYEAIKAMLKKDSDAYLESIAAEVREPARQILKRIQKY